MPGVPQSSSVTGVMSSSPATPERQRLRRSFATPLNAALTVAMLVLLAVVALPLLRWALLDATWTGSANECRAAEGGSGRSS